MSERPVISVPSGVDGVGLHIVDYAPGEEQRPHEHPFASLSLVFRGEVDEWVGDVHRRGRALSVVSKPGGLSHRNRIGPDGARILQLSFVEPLDDLLRHWAWDHGGPTTRRMYRLLCEAATGAARPELADAVVDALTTAFPDRSTQPPPPWVADVVAAIDRDFRSPRLVREMAADVGIHPVALARTFRRHAGSSITERVRLRRVEFAAALIAGGTSLAEAAVDAGFSDQAHLTRAFGRVTGVSPGRYRRLAEIGR